MEYNFKETEQKWQQYWAEKKTFKAVNPGQANGDKPPYYVLDMFPYPSGAGLHVGHPLGYIASDIYARYKRLCGFNVLHPMGYDAFGLPAEQYAIQTGQHPAVTTEQNIKRYREQLDKIGFSFDWDRQVNTSDPKFYKWTQWIFLKLFNCWYNPETDKAEGIETLVKKLQTPNSNSETRWESFSEKEKSDFLMDYRLAYLSEAIVNWCPAMGTVLANDEVKDGVSERGGYPVERKKMKQWSLRITSYAQRLLDDLETIDWTESIKEQQRNWIGRSEGSGLQFTVSGLQSGIDVFTTRPDTVFGATFITLAPEHELVEKITTPEQRDAVNKYIEEAKNRSDRERMTEVKKITGVFTGAYAINPFTDKQIPIWIGDYVLAGYGTGAVMGVPAHDSRDFAFAKHFNLPIIKVIQPANEADAASECFDTYDGIAINSGFLDGLQVKDAIKKIISEIEKRGLGKGKINYRLRDAAFGRQRYWGEPIPIYYKDGIPYTVEEKDLPVVLPQVDKFLPTEDGEPPLARAKNWKYKGQFEFETTTMPGWAGSSWYYLRYMDANNDKEFASKEVMNYWKSVDLYIGGSEHATGHLLYFRFWTKFLFDLGLISIKEPAKKLINQGMIQGNSEYVYRYVSGYFEEGQLKFKPTSLYLSKGIADGVLNGSIDPSRLKEMVVEQFGEDFIQKNPKLLNAFMGVTSIEEGIKLNEPKHKRTPLYVNVSLVVNGVLNYERLRETDIQYKDAYFLLEKNKYICGSEVEKMSKSKLNVVSPDDIIEKTGADALRLYEMFLGPLELSKPWNTNGLSGPSSFIRKLWRVFHAPASSDKGRGEDAAFSVNEEAATKQELKSIHKLIKKATEDIERFSFNTSVSSFMICVNELTDLKCNKRSVLEPLIILISPYAPHIAEELWEKLGHKESITYAKWPEHNEAYLTEDSFSYPVSINGRTKTNLALSLALSKDEIEREVLNSEEVKKFLHGQPPKKVIVVPGRIVNIVV